MVAQLHSFRQVANGHGFLLDQAFQGQQELILPRLDSRLFGRLFAEVQEAANLVAELG